MKRPKVTLVDIFAFIGRCVSLSRHERLKSASLLILTSREGPKSALHLRLKNFLNYAPDVFEEKVVSKRPTDAFSARKTLQKFRI